jgi:pSer/pThr/pTyr-binding forkhead associated (FHA) protein
MPVLVLDLLKYLFIIVLYIFMARAVRAIYLELKPDRGVTASAQPAAKSSKKGKVPRKAVVIEGDELKGKSYDLGQELVIGRGDKCHIILDDSYVSQVHARIFPRGGSVVVEDLGSTNGTYLNRKRVSAPSELQRGDKVKIGRTVMELRK